MSIKNRIKNLAADKACKPVQTSKLASSESLDTVKEKEIQPKQ